MTVSSGFVDFLLDQLDGFGATPRRMFGGTALYRGEAMFGFVYHDRAYFKVDGSNRTDYLDAGMEGLIYAPDKKAQHVESLMEVPPDVLEDPDELAVWAARAASAALAAKRQNTKRTLVKSV